MQDSLNANQDYELWVLLHQVCDAIEKARTNELRPFGISPMQAAVLFVVRNIEAATPAEISRWLFREPNTVSELITRMEKQGLIEKKKDLEKKNLVRIVLTEAGEEAYQHSKEMKIIREIMSYLSPEESKNLRAYLEKLRSKAFGKLGGQYHVPYP